MNDEKKEINEEKLYVVYQHEPYGESRACAFFKNPEKAKSYADCQNKVDSMCDYYVHEDTYEDDKWADNTKALKLYEYVINTDDTIEQAIIYADQLKGELRKLHGQNCEFYPELGVSSPMHKETPGKPNILMGYIDLAVLDENGKINYYDYKTSPKEYSNFGSAKKLVKGQKSCSYICSRYNIVTHFI